MTSPVLWFANRGTGVVLIVLLTATVLLGVLATGERPGRLMPRFVSQSLHRNLSLVAVVLLGAHITSAVIDSYVDIRWWQAVVPFGATYKPLWLSLGTASLDVIAVIVVTSLLRARMPHRRWRVVHLLAYVAWAAALAHGIGIGTDAGTPAGRLLTVACIGAVTLAVLLRLVGLALARARHRRALPVPAALAPAGADQ